MDGNTQPVGVSTDETLVAALRMLATDIQSGDGVANAAIAEAADRLEQLSSGVTELTKRARRIKKEAERLLEKREDRSTLYVIDSCYARLSTGFIGWIDELT